MSGRKNSTTWNSLRAPYGTLSKRFYLSWMIGVYVYINFMFEDENAKI